VALDIRIPGQGIETVLCDDAYELGDVTTVDVSVSAEKNRFTEVPITISFLDSRQGGTEIMTDKSLTIVNVSIAALETDPQPVNPTEPITPDIVVPTSPVTVIPLPTPAKPVVVSVPTYGIPVSNPNGFTDISIRSLGAGRITNNRFVNVGTLNRSEDGAIQFEIKNNGTKTSQSFTFVANLPDGTTYTAPTQVPLKPNERAIITLGFTAINEKDIRTFSATVTVASDVNQRNNSFTAAVAVK
jgi:hypothetical protein